MQTATQKKFKPGTTRKKKSVRAGTMQAIHATWRKVAPPTVVDAEDLRVERLNFATRVLNLNKPLDSMSGLSGAQLGRVLDAMREMERAPALPGGSPTVSEGYEDAGKMPALPAAEIHHLATTAQVEAIEKLFDCEYLRWSVVKREEFLSKRFRRSSPRMLTTVQANHCTMILMSIAAHRRIKTRLVRVSKKDQKVSRTMVHAEIPALKRRLGIDQQKSEVRNQKSADGRSDSNGK